MSQAELSPSQLVYKIKELQEAARTKVAQARRDLQEADQLAKELYRLGGKQFVCNGDAWKLEYKASDMNLSHERYWLLRDTDVRVLG